MVAHVAVHDLGAATCAIEVSGAAGPQAEGVAAARAERRRQRGQLLDATTVIDLVDGHPSAPGVAALLPRSVVCAVDRLEVATWAASRRGPAAHRWTPRLVAAGLQVLGLTSADDSGCRYRTTARDE